MPRERGQYDLGLIYSGALGLFDRVYRDVASDGFAEMLDNRVTPFPFRIVRTRGW